MEEQELKGAIEALLFVSGSPLSTDRLKGIFDDTTKEQIEEQIAALRDEYEARGSCIMLAEVAGGHQLATRPEYHDWIRKFKSAKVSSRLSKAALETLAIIAYHQPATRAEIEEIRGVSVSSGTLDLLIELGWVKFGRRRMTPGRPMTFAVTQDFLDHFGLETERDLPGLAELRAAGLLDNRPAPSEMPGLEKSEDGSDGLDLVASDEPELLV
ncbi:MAG TPA: SMC-Scp complex subunit ScpB [Nitrospiraceae bacterium]|nr:SMC-Scp complex subunit ScpB [Nitrospiraceae bacterium]